MKYFYLSCPIGIGKREKDSLVGHLLLCTHTKNLTKLSKVMPKNIYTERTIPYSKNTTTYLLLVTSREAGWEIISMSRARSCSPAYHPIFHWLLCQKSATVGRATKEEVFDSDGCRDGRRWRVHCCHLGSDGRGWTAELAVPATSSHCSASEGGPGVNWMPLMALRRWQFLFVLRYELDCGRVRRFLIAVAVVEAAGGCISMAVEGVYRLH